MRHVGTGFIILQGIKEDQVVISTVGLCFVAPGLNGIQKDTEGDMIFTSDDVKKLRDLEERVKVLEEAIGDGMSGLTWKVNKINEEYLYATTE